MVTAAWNTSHPRLVRVAFILWRLRSRGPHGHRRLEYVAPTTCACCIHLMAVAEPRAPWAPPPGIRRTHDLCVLHSSYGGCGAEGPMGTAAWNTSHPRLVRVAFILWRLRSRGPHGH